MSDPGSFYPGLPADPPQPLPDPQIDPPHRVFVIVPQRRPYWLHALLFVLTVFTTLIVGARLQYQFANGLPLFVQDDHFFSLSWALAEPGRLWLGLPFTCSVLGILLAHEFGHFIYSVRNRVYATLPFFIPAPTPIGTMGAFIQIKSPFRTRNALFDIAIAGPIAGFAVALPLGILGLMLSKAVPENSDAAMAIGYPLVFHAMHFFAGPRAPLPQLYLHPIAIASWVGMLATSLNLLPGGQLDGGHMVYALAPRMHKWITIVAMVALIPIGFFHWSGWIIWALALFFTRHHPWVSKRPTLSPVRGILFWAGVALFAITFIPVPFDGVSLYDVWRQFHH